MTAPLARQARLTRDEEPDEYAADLVMADRQEIEQLRADLAQSKANIDALDVPAMLADLADATARAERAEAIAAAEREYRLAIAERDHLGYVLRHSKGDAVALAQKEVTTANRRRMRAADALRALGVEP